MASTMQEDMDEDFIKKINKEFMEGGEERVYQSLKDSADKWKEMSLNVAITGNSGSGKSTFINAMRDLTADDEGACDVGVVETTIEPKHYAHPQNSNLLFWDLPGIGSKMVPTDKYIKFLEERNFDYYIILSGARFTENDLWLANYIIKKLAMRCMFVRTKIDDSIENDKRAHPNSFDETAVLERIRNDCKDNLKRQGITEIPVYLISNFDKTLWDFSEVNDTLITDIPEAKRDALVLSLTERTQHIIEEKKNAMSKRVKYTAAQFALSAVKNDVDSAIPILVKEINFQRKQFGLDDRSLSNMVRETNDSIKVYLGSKEPTVNNVQQQFNDIWRTKPAWRHVASSIDVPILKQGLKLGFNFDISKDLLRETLNDVFKDAHAVMKLCKNV